MNNYDAINAATDQIKNGEVQIQFSESVFLQYIILLKKIFKQKHGISPKAICFNTDYLKDNNLLDMVECCKMSVLRSTDYDYEQIALYCSGFPSKENNFKPFKSKILIVLNNNFYTN